MPEGVHRSFLGVRRSVTGKAWIDRLTPASDNIALTIAQTHGISDLVARILAGRGVLADEAPDFLNPTIKHLMPDPYVLQDMAAAAERLARAIRTAETVAIFGDYDVDGATSAALLCRYFNAYGVKPRIYIPDRILEGYGPNPAAIRELVADGATLIVTVDCGVTSFDALEEAQRLQVDVVVLDHHQAGTALPPAHAIVNPNRHDDRSRLGHLAAVGVTFMAVVAMHRLLREEASHSDSANAINLMTFLDLVALGTVCDVVPLQTLNRAFVTRGVMQMRGMADRAANAGLAALARVSRVEGPLTPYHLGFLLGPRINAGGRVGDAGLGARLLTLDDPFRADEIAQRLDVLNSERQALEKAVLEEADAQALAEAGVDDDAEHGPSVLITSSEQWHPGVLGIVAARLKESYRRPAFALAFDRSGKGTGSGRSIGGVDLGKAVREAVEAGILLKGGGHAMAAGLTVQRERLGDLRLFFEQALKADVSAAREHRALTIDGALTARAAGTDLLDEIERAGPYGAGHPAPVFAFPSHWISYAGLVGNGHVKVTIKSGDGASLAGIAFRAADNPLGKALLTGGQKPLHFAGQLAVNSWQGRVTPQLRIIDLAVPGNG